MIGIFVLLFIAMFFVIRYCKNTLKITLSVIIILITFYCIVISADMNRVYSLKEPMFASQTDNHSNITIYQGLGYKVYIEKLENQIISIEMRMFDKVIAAAIT